jgi:hypothetical protein
MSDERSEGARVTPGPSVVLHSSRHVLRSLPWIAILGLTAVVQFIRGAPVDGGVFCVGAAALVVDAAGVVPGTGSLARLGMVPALAGGAVAALLLTLTPRHGVVDGIVLIGIGVAAIPAAWAGVRPGTRGPAGRERGPRPADHAGLRRTAILWTAVAVATCLWELTSFVLGRALPQQKGQHPAISDLLDPALGDLWFRGLFVVGWIALGLAMLSRGGRR